MPAFQLDTVSKAVTLVSVVIGIAATVAGFFATSKSNRLQSELNQLKMNKEVYDASPRIDARFELPLARSFAEQYINSSMKGENTKFSMPIDEITEEMKDVIPRWQQRKGLMTGKPCEQEGLSARQVITLLVKNIGYADAIDVSVKAKIKYCPNKDPRIIWQEMANNKAVPYDDLPSASHGWVTKEFPLEDLRGLGSPEKERNEVKVVLASVSGRSTLYGTVVLPLQISWTDKMTNKRDSSAFFNSQKANLRSNLIGSEIGSLSSSCR